MSDEFNWESSNRGANAVEKDDVFLAVRKTGLKMSSAFAKKANAKFNEHEFVRIRHDNARFCLLLEFFSRGQYIKMRASGDKMFGFYPLVRDGGAEGRTTEAGTRIGGCIINCGAIIRSLRWLKSVSEESHAASRRFVPEQQEKSTAWVVRLMPSFTHKSSSQTCPVQNDDVGIYRYVDDKGNILYIGQGRLASRFAHHQKSKKDMRPALFEWSLISDQKTREKAESFHLKVHEEKFGRLPPWNRVSGKRATQADELN